MKIKQFIWIAFVFVFTISLQAQEELPPYYGITIKGKITALKTEAKQLINESGFRIVGEYKVAGKSNMYVVAFTNDELINLCANYEDRGALASVFKLGLFENDGQTEISILNPKYMFYAYFGEDYNKHSSELDAINNQAKEMISSKYGDIIGFGGGLTPKELEKYHYKVMMPYFDDPEELEVYSGFEEGLAYIRSQIASSGNEIKLVYEVVNESEQTAVFGLGLLDSEKGEPHFLPIIGERHLAAMPYEIILQKDEVTMLAGKYRFALYWPELTMGEFMKIMSTPGDVVDFMESITIKE
jgi:hypothetical protein